jgi:hypothetical protein
MTNYNFLQNDNFLKARTDKDYYFFGDVGLELFTWEEVIKEFNRTVVSNIEFARFENLGLTLFEAENILNVKPFLDEYAKLDLSVPPSAHCYVSFLETSKSFGRHKDKSDVLFWQVIGKTKWIVETLQGVKEHVLGPNEAIFVPMEMYHNVIPLTPRASVSFGLYYDNI